MYGAFVAAVSYRWVAQRETVNPSVAFTQELSHILIHPAAPYGRVLLETSSYNCKPGWSHNRILCVLWVCSNCYCCNLPSIRKRICFKVQVLITDVGLLPIKVWEWMLLQRCSHFSFSDWTEKKWTEISSFWSAEQLSFCTFSTSPLPLWWANFKRPSDQSLAAVSVALLLMKKCVPFLKKTNKQKKTTAMPCSIHANFLAGCHCFQASCWFSPLSHLKPLFPKKMSDWSDRSLTGQQCLTWSLSLIQLPCKVTV